jgi:hypothetical protein
MHCCLIGYLPDNQNLERIDYYTQFKRVARSDPVKRIELFSARYTSSSPKLAQPLLPLKSPSSYAASPLYGLIDASTDSLAAVQASTPGGPWSIVTDLQLPASCSKLHFTNRHKKSNIAVVHTLKIVMRVERGDEKFVDAKTGKRKQFDIVVQTPLHILDVSVVVVSCLPLLIHAASPRHLNSVGALQSGHLSLDIPTLRLRITTLTLNNPVPVQYAAKHSVSLRAQACCD